MDEFNIHNVRFYKFKPEAIHCIAFCNYSKQLAVSRADGNIEIWDCQVKPFKWHTIIGQKGTSIESMVWCQGRLFSAGLNGFIIEYDSQTFMPKIQTSVTGGPTWCLALSPSQQILAAGSEEGFVTLFKVTREGLTYLKTLIKLNGRVLSIGWHFDNEHLVTGSVNYVTLFSLKTDKTLKFPVAKIDPDSDIIVWCVGLLKDKTIVTGDSRGMTCFWDGNFGTLINTVQTHLADILTMQISHDFECIYVAGIDPVIVEVRLVTGAGGRKTSRKMWVKSIQRRIHTHDVRSLALNHEGKLFSGGVDTYLALSYYPPKTAIKYPATPPRGYIGCDRITNEVILGYKNRVEIWKLGEGSSEDNENNRFLHMVKDKVKLAEIELKSNDKLECCALSPRSHWIAYVAKGKIKLYSFSPPSENEKGSLRRVQFEDENIRPSSQVIWIDENRLLSATYSDILQILLVTNGEVEVEKVLTIPANKVARELKASVDGSYVAVLDSSNFVHVFSIRSENVSCVTMPRTYTPVTAFSINNKEIFITYSDMTMAEYDVRTCFCTPFGKELLNGVGNDILKSNNVIQNISFHNPNRVFLHSFSTLYSVNRNPVDGQLSGRANKMMRYEGGAENESNDSCSPVKLSSCGIISTVKRSNHVLFFSHLNNLQLISVELNPVWLMDSLPPALRVKKYGTT